MLVSTALDPDMIQALEDTHGEGGDHVVESSFCLCEVVMLVCCVWVFRVRCCVCLCVWVFCVRLCVCVRVLMCVCA